MANHAHGNAWRRPARRPAKERQCGRPKKLERASSGRRLPRQRQQALQEMLSKRPRDCSIGVKTSSQGYQNHGHGYKLPIDVANGQMPISCLLTSASLRDSQAAIPLATISAQRVTSLYAVMDSAYDAQEIHEHGQTLRPGPQMFLPPLHPPGRFTFCSR